jgi:tetratricopeptide (TPR) repeat protein
VTFERLVLAELFQPEALAFRAEAYLAAGRLAEASRTARQGLELSRAGKQRGYEADTLLVLGEIRARVQPPDTTGAEESYRQALALAEELEMRPLAARCHLGLGRLYRLSGQRQPAREHSTPPRRSCARWTCASGSSRRKRSWR